MRIFAGVMLMIFSSFIVAGCGGGGGGGTPTPQSGSLQGYIYVNQASNQLLVKSAADQSGTAAAGAVVTVRGSSASSTADTGGFFHLDGLTTGAHQFYVDQPGYTRSTFQTTIAAGQNVAPTVTLTPAPASVKWMVMVYMAADNSLDAQSLTDINEMEAAPDSSSLATVVLCDRPSTGALLYNIQHDNQTNTVTSPVLQSLGALDTGNSSTLSWFINYCETNASLPRAEHYMLIMWDHGSGWDTIGDARSTGTVSARAIFEDDTSNSLMRIVDITAALQGQYPIDIIATDACLMAMLEVGYEWRQNADYLVASEPETRWDGYPYDTVLTMLGSATQLTPAQVATNMADGIYTNWLANYDSSSMPAPAISAVDLGRLNSVGSALDILSSRLLTVGKNYPNQLSAIYNSVEAFTGGIGQDHRVDLYDYADRLKGQISDSAVRTDAANLETAVSQAVLTNHHNGELPNAHGISIYLPTKTEYMRNAATSYSGLKLSADTHWNEWLANQPY